MNENFRQFLIKVIPIVQPFILGCILIFDFLNLLTFFNVLPSTLLGTSPTAGSLTLDFIIDAVLIFYISKIYK